MALITAMNGYTAQSQVAQSFRFEVSGDSLAVSPDGRFVARDSHSIGDVTVFDRNSKRVRVYYPTSNDGDVGSKSMVQLGRSFLVAGLGDFYGTSSSSIGIYDFRSGYVRTVARLQVARRALTSTPDGRILIASHIKGGLAFWDVQTGKLTRRWAQFGKGETTPDALSVSSDGKKLATGHYYMLYGPDARKSGTDAGQSPQIWDYKTGRLVVTCQKVRPAHGVDWSIIDFTSLRFSPDGRFLATDSFGHGVAIWNARTGKNVWLLTHPLNRTGRSVIYSSNGGGLVFSPDSKRVASPGNYGTIDVYSLQNGKLLKQIRGGGPLVWTKEGLFFKGPRRPKAEGLLMQVKL